MAKKKKEKNKALLKSVHLRKAGAQTSFLSKVLPFLLKPKQNSENDNTYERNEDCSAVFLKWTDFTKAASRVGSQKCTFLGSKYGVLDTNLCMQEMNLKPLQVGQMTS